VQTDGHATRCHFTNLSNTKIPISCPRKARKNTEGGTVFFSVSFVFSVDPLFFIRVDSCAFVVPDSGAWEPAVSIETRILEGPKFLQMSQVCALPRGQLSGGSYQPVSCPLHPAPCTLHPDRQTGLWCASSRLVGLRRSLASILEGPESLQMSQVCAPHKKFTPRGLKAKS